MSSVGYINDISQRETKDSEACTKRIRKWFELRPLLE